MRAAPMACIVALSTAGGVASAQNAGGDALHVTGRVQMASSASGGDGAIQWLHAVGERTGLEVGGFSGSVADAWWSYGRLGGYRRWRGLTGSAGLDIGGGAQAGRGMDYRAYKSAIGVAMPGRILLDGEVQYVRLSPSPGQRVYRTSAGFPLSHSATVQLGYHRLSSVDASSAAVSARLDLTRGRIEWIAGAVIGTQGPADLQLVRLGLSRATSTEYFAGCRLGVGPYQMLGVFDLTQSPVRMGRILLGIRIPLSSRRQTDQTADNDR